MNAAIAVFRLEIRERMRVFVIALALAILPFAISAMPSLRGERAYAIAMIGVWSALIYGLGVAFALGGWALGRPLADKRMSFYLAKPIGAASLWAGKLVAGLAVSFSAAAIIAVPVAIAVPRETWTHVAFVGDGLGLVLLAGVPLLFLSGNLASTFARSRSIRVAFDFVCLLVALVSVLFLVRPLIAGGAFEATGWTLVILGAVIFVLMLVAPIWQIERGRGAIRESHAALSNLFWAGVGIAILGLAAFTVWVRTAPLSSITTFGAGVQSSDGEWAIVGGETNRGGFHTSFLINTKSGEARRSAEALPWSEAAISGDGRTLITMRADKWFLPQAGGAELVLTPLREGGIRNVIRTDSWMGSFALTRDASRLAVVTGANVTVLDAASGRMLAAGRIPGGVHYAIFFATPDRVRVIARGATKDDREIYELHVSKRTLTRTGHYEGEGSWLIASNDGSRLFVASEGAVLDGTTGAVVSRYPLQPKAFSTMLQDGRVATVPRKERPNLEVYALDGTLQHSIALPAQAMIVGQVGASKLLLRTRDSILLADLARNTIAHRTAAHVAPSYRDHRLTIFAEDGVLVGLDANKDVAAWDVATGAKRAL